MTDHLASTKPTKFVDVPPGSHILIRDLANPADAPVKAIALDVMPEYGPHATPAISYMQEGADGVQTVTATGRWEVEIITSTAQLAALAQGLENVVTGHTKPGTIRAICFKGTPESARDCVLLGSGRAAIRFDPNAEPPTLMIGGLTPEPVRPGDWLVLETRTHGDDTITTVHGVAGAQFANLYDIEVGA